MKIDRTTTDGAVLSELGARLARHRLDRNWSQEELAEEAGVSKRTVERLEAGRSVQLSNLLRVLRALGLVQALDALVPRTAPSPIEQLKLRGRTRQRASAERAPAPPASRWSWGDDRG